MLNHIRGLLYISLGPSCSIPRKQKCTGRTERKRVGTLPILLFFLMGEPGPDGEVLRDQVGANIQDDWAMDCQHRLICPSWTVSNRWTEAWDDHSPAIPPNRPPPPKTHEAIVVAIETVRRHCDHVTLQIAVTHLLHHSVLRAMRITKSSHFIFYTLLVHTFIEKKRKLGFQC